MISSLVLNSKTQWFETSVYSLRSLESETPGWLDQVFWVAAMDILGKSAALPSGHFPHFMKQLSAGPISTSKCSHMVHGFLYSNHQNVT